MKITREQLKETLRTIMREEAEYQQFFKKALEKSGKSIPDMSDEEKKDFFNKIDAAWDGKGEKKNEGNAFGAAVTAAKEKGEDSFEVGGKEYKVESVNEEKYTVIDPRGNSLGTGLQIQAASMAKKKGGEKAGYFVVPAKNALKARRALEKFKGDFKNPKLKDLMSDLFYENKSVNEGRAFINAAKKAKAEGKTEFEFNGKTYPVTIKD